MAPYRVLNRGDVFPASFVAALQETIGGVVQNLRITPASNTTVTVGPNADAANNEVVVTVGGLWRRIIAAQTITHPGGGAGVYPIWVEASANAFASSPAPDTDNTDYNFYAVITSGAAPTGNTPGGQPIVQTRKIGEVDWDGSKIVGIRQLVGHSDGTLQVSPTAPAINIPAGRFRGLSGQTSPILTVEDNTGATLAQVSANGDIVAHPGAGTAVGIGIFGPSGEAGIVLGGEVIYRKGAAVLRTASALELASTLKIEGGGPGAGKVLTSDASGNTSWAPPGAVTPIGPAGGDLGGSYPNPDVESAGDGFDIITGVLTFAGDTAGQLERPAAGVLQAHGEFRVAGNFKHSGSSLGFFGKTPAAQPAARTISNTNVRRTIDRNDPTLTLGMVVDFMATTAQDLVSLGLFQ